MEPHQQRVVDEKRELDEKIAKLVAFHDTLMWVTLPVAERTRLQRQHFAMAEYSRILGERITAFP